jgi:hypothetical protein
MPQAPDLKPPILAGDEEYVLFDFTNVVGAGPPITIMQVTCIVYYQSATSTDATPSARLIGSAFIGTIASGPPYKVTANTNGMIVAQKIGTMVAGVEYTITAQVSTTDGQEISIWTRIQCVAPDT